MTSIPIRTPPPARRSDAGATGDVTGDITLAFACIAAALALTMGVLAVGELRGSGSLLARHIDQSAQR